MSSRKHGNQSKVPNVDTNRTTRTENDIRTEHMDTDLVERPSRNEHKDKTLEPPETITSVISGSSVEIISGGKSPEVEKVNLMQQLQKVKEEKEILQGKLRGYNTLGELYKETREELKKIKETYSSSSQSEYSIIDDEFLNSKDNKYNINNPVTDKSETLFDVHQEMQTENDLILNKPLASDVNTKAEKLSKSDDQEQAEKAAEFTGENLVPFKPESDEKVTKEVISAYQDYMKEKFKGASPLEKDAIKQEHKQASAIAWGIIKRSTTYCDNTNLQELLLPHYQKFVQENNTLSREKCYLLMEHVFADIDAAIKNNSYICENGYEQYLEDKEQAIERYKHQTGKGPMSNHVMEEYLLKRKTEEERIQLQIQLVAYDDNSMTWDDTDVVTQVQTICDTMCKSMESPESMESLHVGQELMAFSVRAMKLEQQIKKYKLLVDSLHEENDKLKHTHQQNIQEKDHEIAKLRQQPVSEKNVTETKPDKEEIPSYETPSTSLTIPGKEWIHVVENQVAEKEEKQYKCDEATDREIEFEQKNKKLKQQVKELAKANTDWEKHCNDMKDHFRVQITNLMQNLEESQENMKRLEELKQNMETEISEFSERSDEKLKEYEEQRTKAVSFASAQASKVDELKRTVKMEQNKSQDFDDKVKQLQSIVGTQKEEIDTLNIQMKSLKDSMAKNQTTEDAVHLTMDNRPPATSDRMQRNASPYQQDSLNTELLVLKQQVTIYKDDFDKERRDRERAQSELSTIRNTFGQINADNRQLQSEIQRKNTEADAMKAAREQDRQKIQRKQEEINRLNVALRNSETKSRELQRQIDVLRRQENQRQQQPPPYEYNPRPNPVRQVHHQEERYWMGPGPRIRRVEHVTDFLPDHWKRQIQSKLTQFTRNLRPDDVILQLYTKGIVSYSEKQDLEVIPAEYKRSEKLILDVVMRGTKSDLATFKQILIDTQQIDLALILPGESRPPSTHHAREKWNCLVCTFENSGDRLTCEMCRSPAPRPGAYIPRGVEQCDDDSVEWVVPAQYEEDGGGGNNDGDQTESHSNENEHTSSTGRKMMPE